MQKHGREHAGKWGEEVGPGAKYTPSQSFRPIMFAAFDSRTVRGRPGWPSPAG